MVPRSTTRALTHLTRLSLAVFCGLPAVASAQSATPQRFPSPHGKYVIEAVTRDPGGVGAPQTIVSLHRSRNKVATYQDNILVVDGAHPVTAKWVPGDQLDVTITCEGCDIDGAVLKVGKFEEVRISYQTHAPDPTPTTAPSTKPPSR